MHFKMIYHMYIEDKNFVSKQPQINEYYKNWHFFFSITYYIYALIAKFIRILHTKKNKL